MVIENLKEMFSSFVVKLISNFDPSHIHKTFQFFWQQKSQKSLRFFVSALAKGHLIISPNYIPPGSSINSQDVSWGESLLLMIFS